MVISSHNSASHDGGEAVFCANCFVPIPWEPVVRDGKTYCCQGCAAGGPCICSYQPQPVQPSASERAAPEAGTPEGAAAKPAAEPASPASAGEPLPRLGSVEYRDRLQSSLQDLLTTCVRLLEAVADRTAEGPDEAAEAEVAPPAIAPAGHAGATAAAPVTPRPAVSLHTAAAPDQEPAEDVPCGPVAETGPDRISLLLTPVKGRDVAEGFAEELGAQPLVQRAILLDFVPDDATYQVDTPSERRLVQFLLGWPRLHLRRTRIMPGRVELALSEPLALPGEPEEAPAAPEPAPRPQRRPAVSAPTPRLARPAITVRADVFFHASHFLGQDNRQSPVHAHSWRVQTQLAGRAVHGQAMLLPFAEAKRRLQEAVSRYDNTLLNDIPPFDSVQPTSSNLAAELYDELSEAMAGLPMRLISVSVWDSPASCATYPEG